MSKFNSILQEKEKRMLSFCKVCSSYIIDKEFSYDPKKYSFSISRKIDNGNEEIIGLSDLSSGEKQIVSFFSHLYLTELNNYFVLIDEPELSLSVPWQRKFLIDIQNSGLCSGLVAVTHSPFTYENELKEYAHSLGEFLKY